ncbi:MAG TPA: DUF1697 domain-containing protein [Polyangiaceae bacterium]|nr:DUF1697 domain-containing protein [Polyangiaceae bacterium]
MTRYAALIRGVSPMNCSMPKLKKAFESAGFGDVRTVLASGNVVFDARSKSEASLEQGIEALMKQHFGRPFACIVRSVDTLRALVASDPYAPFPVPRDAKRVVTFLRERPARKLALPIELDGARIVAMHGREAFTAYVQSPKGAVFMVLLEKTFGKDQTTRTWGTVEKLAR